MTSKLFPYSPAPESRAIVNIASSYGLFIGGEFVDSLDGELFKTVNPATEEVLAEVVDAGPRDIDRAVAAARKAYEDGWRDMPGKERSKYLFRIARIIQERSRELAVSRATSICRSSRHTSSTTRAGPTSSSTRASVPTRRRSASPGKSFRGTSR
jgi:aldehyde dehydrogenase (NAD+)